MLWMALSGGAATANPVVVELYTSQGCSSCPPADALLGEIADRDDVIALGLHVDYWDYIGWKDQFADPAFSARQRAYARAAGQRTVYTPQIIVNGRDHLVGYKPMKLAELMQTYKARPLPVSVDLRRDGDRVEIEARAVGEIPSGGCVVQVLTYDPYASVEIGRGENAGRTLEYFNIVRDLVEVGRWDGNGTWRATVRVPADRPVAVLVQARDHGPILGAAKSR